MFKTFETLFRSNRTFVFLVFYRWVSLLPAVFVWKETSSFLIDPFWVLALALSANVFISLFNRSLNKLVAERPLVLGVDLLFSGFILAVSGGMNSPYYLYALNPLLAGAFFFQMRGAFTASALFTPLCLAAYYFGRQANIVQVISQLAGIWLIPILFAYPSALLKDINRAQEELAKAQDELAAKHENLANAHRQLEIIHDLTVLLQAAPDLLSVQERVLGAVTTDLGFSKAVVAMVDPRYEEIGGWVVYPPVASFPATRPLPLSSESGEIVRALLNRQSFVTGSQTLVRDAQLDSWLRQNEWYVLPLNLREHSVGVLLVEEAELTPERKSTLVTVANQAALALGTTILCIDRARRLAVETERNRIASDIHDTVAQSLFGIVYSLDACIKMLPEQAGEVKNELIELRQLANNAHDEVRRSIFDLWPSALTIELFMADLTNYVSGCCRPRSFSIVFNHHGDFNSLSPGLRRTVYRMAQEALANAARHSGANSARLCLTVTEQEVYLDISDQGSGFDPSIALSRSQSREHFGLRGIQDRAHALGGDCEIISNSGAGTRIMIQLPTKGRLHA